MYRNRKGSAAIEAAVCLPVLAFIVVAAVEVSGGIFQNYDAQAAAFELSKLALRTSSTCDDVQAKANTILPQLGFSEYDVKIEVEPRTVNADSVDPPTVTLFNVPKTGSTTAGLEEVPRGTLLRLTVTADRPMIPGRGMMRRILADQVEADCVFVKEF